VDEASPGLVWDFLGEVVDKTIIGFRLDALALIV